jgi:hypothetical protein
MNVKQEREALRINFNDMPHDDIVYHLSKSLSEINTKRNTIAFFTPEEERLLRELEDNAYKLEQARRGL